MIPIDFIHIPKSGGTSIHHMIKEESLTNITYRAHEINPNQFDREYSMVILRDPIDRFLSSFYYSKGNYPNCKLTLDESVKTPSDLVKGLIKGDKEELLIDSNHYIGNEKTGLSWIWTPQYKWWNGAKYVLMYENIISDFSDFLKVTGREDVKLLHFNKSKRKEHIFSPDEIEYIKDRYSEDFKLIEFVEHQEWKSDLV
jgi:hypothetical protein